MSKLKLFSIFLGLIVSSLSYISLSQAQIYPETSDGYDTQSAGSSGGACDFGQFLDALGQRESNNNYGAKNSFGFIGRWQMHPNSSLADIGWSRNGVWTGNALNYGITSQQDYLNSAAGQDQAMKEWMDLLARRAEIFGVTKHIGTTVKGCSITWSGIIAGRHLCGYGKRSGGGGKCAGGTSLIQFLESGGAVDGVDGYGTPVSEYVCKFSGLNMPYEHGGQATDCSTVNNAGETSNTQTPSGEVEPAVRYTGSPGAGQEFVSVSNPTETYFGELSSALKYVVVAAFQNMTTELTTFMMQQVNMIGQFFDAKHQLETQRLLQEKTAQAHKDYHPSTQMCMIGTFARNLIDSERRSDLTKTALTQSMLDRALATGDSQTSQIGLDSNTRQRALIDRFCNKADNAQQNSALCQDDIDPDDVNADINFTRTIDVPLTLDIDLLDDTENKDEETIFAFLDYIFMHEKFPYKTKSSTVLFQFIEPYMDMRSTIAIRSVAQNSFAEIIAQKAAGPDGDGESVGPFMKALLRDFGIEDNAIQNMIGENPSYYAQMEILTKTIYQHPEFISNLYDKPANVKRIRAALTAIKLMQDRDIHDALMRREMLMSMLLELQLRKKQQELINQKIDGLNKRPAGQADQTAPNAPKVEADPADSGF